MKKFIKYILLIISLLISLDSVYSQATLKITEYYIQGKNCGGYQNLLPYVQGQTFPFPSLSACNQAKQQIISAFNQANAQLIGTGCKIVLNCNCSGSDPVGSSSSNQSSAGSSNINGTSQGSAFFSSSLSNETKDWMNNVTQKLQSLGISNNLSNFIPTTGNKDFDAMYGNLMKDENKTEEFSVLPKGSGSSGVVLDDTKGLTVNDAQRGVPIAPSIDNNRYMLLSGIEHDIQTAIDSLDRINRYCKVYPSDCGSFQKKKEELEKKIGDAKNNLSNLKTDDYTAEIEKYHQQLYDYNDQLSKCQTELCRDQIEKAKEAINEKIINVSNELSGLKSEIDNIKSNDYGTEFDKRDAIADMRMDRINEQLKNGEITYSTANSMMANVQAEKREIDAERVVTNAYEKTSKFVKENKDIVIDAGEFATKTLVSSAGIAFAPGSGGSSLVGAKIINYEITIYANQLRGQEFGEAVLNATTSTAKNVVIDYFVPVRINRSGLTVSDKDKGIAVEYIRAFPNLISASDKINGISVSKIIDTGKTGMKLAGFKSNKEKE